MGAGGLELMHVISDMAEKMAVTGMVVLQMSENDATHLAGIDTQLSQPVSPRSNEKACASRGDAFVEAGVDGKSPPLPMIAQTK